MIQTGVLRPRDCVTRLGLHDGKKFGYGMIGEEIAEFSGARKITSLDCYPLRYYKNDDQLREELIARGKKFVSLCGVHYKAYTGMAYMKRRKAIIKFNIWKALTFLQNTVPEEVENEQKIGVFVLSSMGCVDCHECALMWFVCAFRDEFHLSLDVRGGNWILTNVSCSSHLANDSFQELKG